jgi:IclR family transcriptional regulator, acetate operon repressor
MIVRQVQCAFQILEFFAQRRSPATLTEIAEHFGWPRSSTFNLLETLSSGGFLYEPKFRAGYYPSHKLLRLAQNTIMDGPVSERLRNCVVNIAQRTDETAALCALSGTQTVFVDVVEASSPIRYFAEVGMRVPTHATSAGRALLSMLTPKERMAILKKSEIIRYAPDTIMDIEAIEKEVQASNARGWALNVNGFEPELVGIAVPIALKERQFSLLIAGPSYRMKDKIIELAQMLKDEVQTYLIERAENE